VTPAGDRPAPRTPSARTLTRWWGSGPAVFLAVLLLSLAAFGWLAWRDAGAADLLREGERVPGVVTEVD